MIVVAAATPWESAPLARALGLNPLDDGKRSGARRWSRPDGRLILVETGMGPGASTAAMDNLGAPRVSLVVSSGLAGALSEEARPGDIVADLALAPPTMGAAARRLAVELGLRLHEGPLASSDHVVASPEDKRALGTRSGAMAVDMESEALQAWARGRGAAFAAVRAVLDGVDDRLPESAPKGPGARHLLFYAAARWRDLPLLAKLGLRQRRAMAKLCAFLVRILSEVRDEQTA